MLASDFDEVGTLSGLRYGNYYLDAPEQDPAGPETGEDRVARGGSWSFPPRYLRVSTRLRAKPDGRAEDFGFRCVVDQMP